MFYPIFQYIASGFFAVLVQTIRLAICLPRHLNRHLSRKFATTFRDSFKEFEHKWKNVSVKFGPQTLMEGWLKIDLGNFQDDILELANNFLEIEYLVDDALAKFK
jgi:hypothetical protein